MKRKIKLLHTAAICAAVVLGCLSLPACAKKNDEVVLRVSNWEEYIDLGDWDEEELIDIDNPFEPEKGGVIGKNSMVDDFTDWFNSQNYGFDVRVEYSTFGTNEDMYNRLNLGDNYDLVCPSDYMIMKLINEDKVEKFSSSFMDESIETNYYARNVSPYIDGIFSEYDWREYAACYMWGTTGIIYNTSVNVDDVTTWSILQNSDYKRQVTIKDNVRDSYFAALAILNADELKALGNGEDDGMRRSELLNSTDADTIGAAEDILKTIKDNIYSFETDSGKSDMITGKVLANLQWSGDAVYIMDEAEDDGTELWYSVPYECTNLWFDGWVMLKDGIDGDGRKKTAAEAFINFLSRPDNAIRNMYYIGYTSSIAGDMVFDYLDWNYGADEDAESIEYDVSYFFGDGHVIYADAADFEIDGDGTINRGRQLFAQYPPENVTDRSVVMLDFGDKLSDINQMWINVRCLDVKDFDPAVVWSIVAVVIVCAAALVLYKFRYRIFERRGRRDKKDD